MEIVASVFGVSFLSAEVTFDKVSAFPSVVTSLPFISAASLMNGHESSRILSPTVMLEVPFSKLCSHHVEGVRVTVNLDGFFDIACSFRLSLEHHERHVFFRYMRSFTGCQNDSVDLVDF
jgi:hypothetical protein